MNAAALLWLGAAIPTFIAAASLSRLYVSSDRVAAILAALALYAVGNLMMVRLMRESGLALAISVSSVAQLILVNLVAVLVFGERLPATQLTGMTLGTIGLVLMMWPQAVRP